MVTATKLGPADNFSPAGAVAPGMTFSRNPHPSRRTVVAAAGGSLSLPLLRTPAHADPAPRRGGLDLRWLGTTGWRFEHEGHVLAVDPYLTRFRTGLAAGAFDPSTPLRVDEEACRAVSDVRTVLVTHSHWDHVADVPHLAVRDGARVLGSLTTASLVRAMGVPEASTSTLRGGEQLDLGEYVVHALPALHSRTASWSVLFPGVRTTVPEPPATISDLPEGDTLGFHVRPCSGPSVLVLGASDVDDRALQGLRPDVVTAPVPSNDATHDYLPRLLEALGRPPVVVPSHWDDFESPLSNPPRPATPDLARRLEAFELDVRRISPRSRVVRPRYLEPLPL
ncbi:MBL fold metallo-hydrolase [Nocardioides aestuarii]|uniref:MBL fold metallo-hydrolase n=1 Tax=Nocardioides aestuarii TaxID=252231 RepID=A0ABW4TRY7_9ACTN